jgi:hypothetical protein
VVALQTPAEKVVSGATGHFTDKTMWYIVGGVILMIVGGACSFKKK